MGWKTEASNIRAGLASGSYKKKRNYAKAFMEPFQRGIERQEIERIQKDKEDRARAAAASKAAAAEQKSLDKADAARQGMVSMIMLNNGIEPTAEINKQLMMVAKNGGITDVTDFQTYYDDYVKYDQGRAATPLNQVDGTLPPEMQLKQDTYNRLKAEGKNEILNLPANIKSVADGIDTQEGLNSFAENQSDKWATLGRNGSIPAPDQAAFVATESKQMDDLGLGKTDPSLTFGKKPIKVADMDQRAIVAELKNTSTSPERAKELQAGLDAINFETDEDQFDKLPTVTDLNTYEIALVQAQGLVGSAKDYAVKRIEEQGEKLRTNFDKEFLAGVTTIEQLIAKEGELAAMKGTDANGEAVVNELYPGQVLKYQGLIDKQMTALAAEAVAKSRRNASENKDPVKMKGYTRNLETGEIISPISAGVITQTATGDPDNPYEYTNMYGEIIQPEDLKELILHPEEDANTIVKVYNKAITKAADYITESTVAVTAIMDLQAFVEAKGKSALNPITNWLGKLADNTTAAGDAVLTLSNIFQNDDKSLKTYEEFNSTILKQFSDLEGDDKIVSQKTLAAAYAIAKMRGSVGQALSDKELKAILETLGVGVTQPKKVIDLLDQLILSEVPQAEIRRKTFSDGIIKVGGEVEILNTTSVGTPIYGNILKNLQYTQDKEKFRKMFADPLAGRPLTRAEVKPPNSDLSTTARELMVEGITAALPDVFSNPSGGKIVLTPEQTEVVKGNFKTFATVLREKFDLSDDEIKAILEKAKKDLGI